jgi:hypothetical protein
MEPDENLLDFSVERNKGYGAAPIPSPRDEEIGRVIDQILDGSQNLKELRARLPGDSAETLMAYAERMASLASRRNDERLVRSALCALALIELVADVRDLILIIAVVYDAAQRVAGAPLRVTANLEQCAGTTAWEEWLKFARRLPKNQALSAFGYEAGEDADGFRYRRNW